MLELVQLVYFMKHTLEQMPIQFMIVLVPIAIIGLATVAAAIVKYVAGPVSGHAH